MRIQNLILGFKGLKNSVVQTRGFLICCCKEQNLWHPCYVVLVTSFHTPLALHEFTIQEFLGNSILIHSLDVANPAQVFLAEEGIHGGDSCSLQDDTVGDVVLPGDGRGCSISIAGGKCS